MSYPQSRLSSFSYVFMQQLKCLIIIQSSLNLFFFLRCFVFFSSSPPSLFLPSDSPLQQARGSGECILKLQGVPKKCTKFMHHNFATVCHRVMRFSAKCSERNCLNDKDQCLNKAIKYSLFCSWQLKYLKIQLAAKSLRKIRGINTVHVSRDCC